MYIFYICTTFLISRSVIKVLSNNKPVAKLDYMLALLLLFYCLVPIINFQQLMLYFNLENLNHASKFFVTACCKKDRSFVCKHRRIRKTKLCTKKNIEHFNEIFAMRPLQNDALLLYSNPPKSYLVIIQAVQFVFGKFLTIFRVGPFGDTHGCFRRGRPEKQPSLNSFTYVLQL